MRPPARPPSVLLCAAVLAACARAVHRMAELGMTGCRTLFDVAPAWLSPRSGEDLRAHML